MFHFNPLCYSMQMKIDVQSDKLKSRGIPFVLGQILLNFSEKVYEKKH